MLKLVSEGKAIKLAEKDSGIKTESLKFMTLRVQKAGTPGGQILINKDQLLKVFTETSANGHEIVGNNIKYVDSGAVEHVSAVVKVDGLKVENLEVKDGYLLLGDTEMSSELFTAIKKGVGNEDILSYNITVLSGETKATDKIATIKFSEGKTEIVEYEYK